MQSPAPYAPKNKIRIVTASSLFDGHDAAINIMRRIMQATGAEVIHLGHNRSAHEVVTTAIQEDVQAIAITSYQGGHIEYFKYMYDLLKQCNASHIQIFGGGGGTILPTEIAELHQYGIARIYSPDDGRQMGLQGMINDLLQKSDFAVGNHLKDEPQLLSTKSPLSVARLISAAENFQHQFQPIFENIQNRAQSLPTPVLGITGTGGAGKSSLIDELVRRFITDFDTKTLAIVSVDPSKRKTGGALLGDRIRLNAVHNPRIYMRSLATRQSNLALSKHIPTVLNILKLAGYDLIILETSGIGQSDTEIIDYADASLYVMTPEYGAATQLEKIDMLDFADVIALNKFDKRGAQDALRAVQKQYQRNRNLWDTPLEQMPVWGTMASQFNDQATHFLYQKIIAILNQKKQLNWQSTLTLATAESAQNNFIIPPARTRYLAEIAENNRNYDFFVKKEAEKAAVAQAYNILKTQKNDIQNIDFEELEKKQLRQLSPQNQQILEKWDDIVKNYKNDFFVYKIRDKEIKVKTYTASLSNLKIPKVATPPYSSWSDRLKWTLQENYPGEFPYTAGVFPFKRTEEDPTRMFAGEGNPERTNKRFHYLAKDTPAKRLSTAFDSVTLYGENPDYQPDIYGKIGNSGVSICSLNDAKKLYSGFDLCHPATSVSMTINGPAAIITAFFMNAAIDQQCELYIVKNGLQDEVKQKIKTFYEQKNVPLPTYYTDLPPQNNGLGLLLLGITGSEVLPAEVYQHIKAETLTKVRGTVQADILKEDQAQNTCIFSTEFSLRLMGDMQQYFIQNGVQNFYSVSISGYHIAEAGANPISQLAFTLANGFTYIEYYLARGMNINDFAPNLSFFFSNGIDPEYAVIGRVARRIWAKALKLKYNANDRSQKLKYHIQTSGRSLHAQEIAFNDIRTTLQALYAIYDNCNSLHTNAYDEAITTPTEESVRRAVAIQLIINKELGLAKNENPLQGSFIIEELTDLVEEAVLLEFERITERGGVLGAMETMYQRGKIQEESLYYETLKHTGEYPIIGVNTFLSSEGSPTIIPKEVIRSTTHEKELQIQSLNNLHILYKQEAPAILQILKKQALTNQNLFECLMETVKYCSLGQITNALYEVGGKYRRNM